MPVDATVLELYRTGVVAVGTATHGWEDDAWHRPACGVWDATDLAGHLVTVVGWYHAWLDRAIAGDATPAFEADELDERTLAALRELPVGTGPERIATFRREADRYADRLLAHWDLPYGYPRGTVTAGLHAGVAAVEWHVHAWDLAHAVGTDHVPTDPTALYVAAARCQLALVGGPRERAGNRLAAPDSRGRPWPQLLARTGRR